MLLEIKIFSDSLFSLIYLSCFLFLVLSVNEWQRVRVSLVADFRGEVSTYITDRKSVWIHLNKRFVGNYVYTV